MFKCLNNGPIIKNADHPVTSIGAAESSALLKIRSLFKVPKQKLNFQHPFLKISTQTFRDSEHPQTHTNFIINIIA